MVGRADSTDYDQLTVAASDQENRTRGSHRLRIREPTSIAYPAAQRSCDLWRALPKPHFGNEEENQVLRRRKL